MIEQAIFSCIGFLIAALLALAAAPAVSRRARRLAEARARLQAPLTEAQAIAERDALRAQHAVDQVRLERRLGAAEDIAALRQIEIGRQSNRILVLEEIWAGRREEFSALEAETRELRGELGAAQLALRDLTFQRDSADAACAAAEARRLDLETLADQNRAIVATSEMRVSTLELRLADSERAASAAAKSAEVERARLAAALSETEALISRNESSREEALLENGRRLTRLAERDAALREAEAARRDLADRLDAVRAERAELQREADGLRALLAKAPSGGRASGDQALRKAIAGLGRKMARLNGEAPAAEKEPSNLVSFDRRDAHARPAGSGEAMHSAPTVLIRQGQPMAPER